MRRVIEHLPKREALMQHRLIRPFAHHMSHGSLWHLNRRSVAKGVAIGLFFAFITPIAQIPFAAAASIPFRANIAVAALSTLITNPLTFGPVWFLAHRVGRWMLDLLGGSSSAAKVAWMEASGLWDKIIGLIGPTAVGLILFAIVSSLLGYLAVKGAWSLHLIQRRKGRRIKSLTA